MHGAGLAAHAGVEDELSARSVDTKKKELAGNFKNNGREWRRGGVPELVNVHNFIDPKLSRATLYDRPPLLRQVSWIFGSGSILSRRKLPRFPRPAPFHFGRSGLLDRAYRVRQFSEALDVEMRDEIRQRHLPRFLTMIGEFAEFVGV